MSEWTMEKLQNVTVDFITLSTDQKSRFLVYMTSNFPPSTVESHLKKRSNALNNMETVRSALQGAHQEFPNCLNWETITASPKSLDGVAIVFTAGGEGERLRISLLEKGVPEKSLNDFTKATYPLEGFYEDFGALHINLSLVSWYCSHNAIDIPVIVTTGPKGSITARVIPEILNKYKNFGLKNIKVVEQDERIHFTEDNKIAFTIVNDTPVPVTQPDETGGPLMKLKQPENSTNDSPLTWLAKLGIKKILIVQATALYDQRLLPLMAASVKNYDCLAVGILRSSFPEKDPFGTFVTLRKENTKKSIIVEQDVRNELTRTIKDPTGEYYLPFNTGFYGIDTALLINNDLPDFATPPKEVLPGLPRSSKIGYAATDVLPLAKDPVILVINQGMFGVIKTAADLTTLTELGHKFDLLEICKEVATRYRKY